MAKRRSPGHQARRDDAAKRIKKAYRASKANAVDMGLTKPKDKIASGKFAADRTKQDIANDRKYQIRHKQNTRRIRTERRAHKKAGTTPELNVKKTIDAARQRMQWDLKKTDKAMKEIVNKTTTPQQRALAKQRIEQRKKGYAAKRAADTRTHEQALRDLEKSTSRLKNKTARRKLKRNTEGQRNKHKTQQVGRAANDAPRKPPTGPGRKMGGYVTRGASKLVGGPVGAALLMGEAAYRLNDTTSKGRSTGGRNRKQRQEYFKSAHTQDADRAKAKHDG